MKECWLGLQAVGAHLPAGARQVLLQRGDQVRGGVRRGRARVDDQLGEVGHAVVAVAGVEGTWKLGQNEPEGAAERAAAGLATSDIGSELGALAALMKTPPG